MSSLQALLAQLPQDADAKGRAFERLVKWFLENAPEYKALLKKVHHWGSSPHRWGRDTGIDLTAEAYDGTLWAIQAKAYDASYYVTKQDVDKFLSESGRRPRGRPSFDVKLLVATTDYLGANARAVLDDTPGARRLLLADLEKASILWPRSLGDLRPAKAKVATPKPHQRAAIRDVIDGFGRVSRGQLIMACGTGKTLTALWAAEALEARRVLVLVPSLSLVRQTLASWYAHSTHAPPYIVICSDESVHRGEDGTNWLQRPASYPIRSPRSRMRLRIFSEGQGTATCSPRITPLLSSRPPSPGPTDCAHSTSSSPTKRTELLEHPMLRSRP
jgi:predicted helicase